MKRRQWLLFALLLLCLLGAKLVAYRWFLDRQGRAKPVALLACRPESASCLLPNGLRLRVESVPRVGTPFVVDLSGRAGLAHPPEAEFAMESMNMGFNRYRFLADGANWRLHATLPECVSGQRDWQMTLVVDGQRYKVPLEVR